MKLFTFFRYFLLPLSWIYGGIVFLNNLRYLLRSNQRFHVPKKSIVVGNLAVGGTGKTPMVAYLIQLLTQKTTSVQVISRGYGRKTKGFVTVNTNSLPEEVGDEPLLLKKRFPTTNFAVCEQRKKAIEKIEIRSSPDLYLFDDAFQHLAIQAEKYLLLTTFERPYFNDFPFPAGNLREFSIGRKRADWVIVTKCPPELSETTKEKYRRKLRFSPENIFFSSIQYDTLQSFSPIQRKSYKKVLIVTGIAHPQPLEVHFSEQYEIKTIRFPDHHSFTQENIATIHRNFDKFASNGDGIIVTTEKDFVKLSQNEFQKEIQSHPWYYQPITIRIDRQQEFEQKILQYVNTI